jgi:hypothetical protein
MFGKAVKHNEAQNPTSTLLVYLHALIQSFPAVSRVAGWQVK